ncbi:MAG: hypothetical protein MUC68_18525 [Burkholderiaceae bacterium]|nr:hypothetical protein [Burkholderiaceae bacterium]
MSSAHVAAALVALAMCVGALVPAGPVVAVEIIAGDYKGRRVLLVRDEPPSERNPRGGRIFRGDAKKLEAALGQGGPYSEVLFNSGGGSEADGLAMGRLIRSAGLSTRITADAHCASACADAFLGGVARRVENGGRYGIHMPTIAGNPEMVNQIAELIDRGQRAGSHRGAQQVIFEIEQLSARAASRWAAYVIQMGASVRLVDAGTQKLASEMKWLNRAELLDLNVVNVDD